MPLLDHFSLIAPLYEAVFRPPEPDALAKTLVLPIEGTLIDVGGGTGRMSGTVRDYVGRVIIVDPSAGMIAQANGKRDVAALRAESEGLPFANGAVERVLIVDALHHFADQQRAIREVMRVLAPGGMAALSEPDIRHWFIKLVALSEKLIAMRSHFLPPEKIAALFRDAGASNVRIEQDGLSVWVFARK